MCFFSKRANKYKYKSTFCTFLRKLKTVARMQSVYTKKKLGTSAHKNPNNSYFSRILCLQLLLEAVYSLELSKQLISETQVIGIAQTIDFGCWSINWNCPGKRFRVLSINWNYLNSWYPVLPIKWKCPNNWFRVLSIEWNCPNNWFRRLEVNWNCPHNSFQRPPTTSIAREMSWPCTY